MGDFPSCEMIVLGLRSLGGEVLGGELPSGSEANQNRSGSKSLIRHVLFMRSGALHLKTPEND
jgi:hypothetical protein